MGRPAKIAAFACAYLVSLAGASSPARAAAPQEPAEPRTQAAVVAADRAWSAAETGGQIAFLEWLMEPGYRSVDAAGKVTDKAAILGSARAHAGPERAAKVAAWRAAHPVTPEVQIVGDTAVLTWVSTKIPGPEPVSSCDIFVYRDGHWHPVYSQHSDASS